MRYWSTIPMIAHALHQGRSAPANPTTKKADGASQAIQKGPVRLGQFVCSAKDAAQVKSLTPIDSMGQLQSDNEALEAQERELNELKTQIDIISTNDLAAANQLDYRRQMVDKYNSSLDAYQRDGAALKQRIDTYNLQIEAHDTYLAQHCKRDEQ